MSKQQVDIISSFEQFETSVTQIAIVLGEYYKTLLQNNVPADLARKLVTDAHQIWWVAVLNNSKRE